MRLLLVAVAIIILFVLLYSPKNGYVPDKAGSGGLNPDGGMRNALFEQSELSDRNVSYNHYDVTIYDNYEIPERMVWNVGHWSNLM